MAVLSTSNRTITIANFSFKLVLLFLLLSFLTFTTEAADGPTFLHENCTSNETFNANSIFQSNLRTLLSSLTSNATGNSGFYNTTVAPGNHSDAVYGLFMCRGDVPLDLCRGCVLNATQRLGVQGSGSCRFSKIAIIWYDKCMVRYSNRNFFSTVDTRPRLGMWNTKNITDSMKQIFMSRLYTIVNEVADETATGDKKYATKQKNLSAIQTLYALAQCTPELSPNDCRSCLSIMIAAISWCCTYSAGGRVLCPNCNFRYELYPFFYRTGSLAPTPAPAGLVPPTPPAKQKGRQKGQSPRTIVVVVIVSFAVAVALFCFAYCFLRSKRRKSYKSVLRENFGAESIVLESLQFSLAAIEVATNKFSSENKIGKGGFGEVYKGILSDARHVAIKRLSRSSGQGSIEFKNEVLLIAKLQHRNLVTLLGFCLEGEEKILIYEYVPNNSLDYFLFGTQNRSVLNWQERYQIIGGIAQGILYLHKYSRLKIIHRDLKPSNILLDNNMNPKISDFGIAKMVGIDEDQGSTKRVVGTFGYMSPEYTILGQYSEKSDVFSFGVIVMEIISGKKNVSRYESQYVDGLLSYVWKKWRDEKWLEILDSNLSTEVVSHSEVLKCIQIGLLCVQENPNARPSMVTVVSYLSNDSVQLPFPQEPAFFMHSRMEPPIIGEKISGSSSNSKPCSINEMSMSGFYPR